MFHVSTTPTGNGDIRTVRLDTLVTICRFLACQPGDLLSLSVSNGEREGEPA
ncbi:MAG: helix-turn-helix domain-containing protein [Candidatus Promineofilum sp.]|nr:helix-turn-helix domain-containing protein [Promineifilum sp.]